MSREAKGRKNNKIMPEKYRVICLKLDKLKATVASINRIAIEKRMIFSLHSFKNILKNMGSSPLLIPLWSGDKTDENFL
jgi:hypothetical protein